MFYEINTNKENSVNCSWSLLETVLKVSLTSQTNVLLDQVWPVFLLVQRAVLLLLCDFPVALSCRDHGPRVRVHLWAHSVQPWAVDCLSWPHSDLTWLNHWHPNTKRTVSWAQAVVLRFLFILFYFIFLVVSFLKPSNLSYLLLIN